MSRHRGAGSSAARPGGPARHGSRTGLVGLLTANLVSVAGGAVSLVALPRFVLATTGSTVATGMAAVCETVPLVTVALVAGAVVNRFGAAATRVGSDLVSAFTVLAIPVLHASVGLSYWQLLVLVAVNGAVRAPAPAASLVLLIAAWGAPTALVVDAASFALSAVVLAATLRLRRHPDPIRSRHQNPPKPVWAGLGVLAQDRLLRTLCTLGLAVAVLEGAWTSVLAPAYGQRVLHSPTALGLLLGVFGLGALTGNLAYPQIAARTHPHLLVWTCLAASTTVRYGALSTTTVLPILAATVLPAGLASGLLTPLWLRLLSDRTDPQLHGHVFGVTFGFEQGGTALGALTCGLLLTHLSIPTALTAAAGIGVDRSRFGGHVI